MVVALRLIMILGALLGAGVAQSQSLDDRLDKERFLRGLSERGLEEVIEHYAATNPPASPVDATLVKIAIGRIAATDAASTSARRLEAIEEVLALRKELIDSNTDDPRYALWLADQASDFFFLLYPFEGTGVTSEFGLPSPEQRQRTGRIARSVFDLASEAEIAISDAILDLEGQPGFTTDVALQLRRRRLARDERDRRIPFLLGVGAYLHATVNVDDQTERRRLLQLASELLPPLADELEGRLRTQTRLYAGLAALELGNHEAAAAFFEQVREGESVAAQDRFAASVGQFLIERRQDPAAARETLNELDRTWASHDNLFFRILLADQRFLLLRDDAMNRPPEERPGRLADAFEVYIDLLNVDLGVPREVVRPIVMARLANAADSDVPLERLPPMVAVARAENLARAPSTRNEAIEMLRTLLDSDEIDEATEAAALFSLARAHVEAGQWREAARLFDHLARTYPRDPQAESAVEMAAAILIRLYAEDAAAEGLVEQIETTLSLLLERYSNLPQIERWRYEAAKLHLNQGELAEARTLLEATPPGASVWPDARHQLAEVAIAEARAEEVSLERRSKMQAAWSQAIDAAATIERARDDAADPDRRQELSSMLARLRLIEAEALLGEGRTGNAIEVLNAFENAASGAGTATSPEILAEALSLRVKALHQMGRTDEASKEIQRLIRSYADKAGDVLPSMLAAIHADVEQLIKSGKVDEAREKANRDLVPLAEALEQWVRMATPDPVEAFWIQLRIADAYRIAERFDRALSLYDALLLQDPAALQAIYGRAESFFGLGRFEEAIADYKRIAIERAAALDDFYWQAEVRMLQVLDRALAPEDPRLKQIVPRIERLRKVDPRFGGERFRREFESLQNKYSRQ